MRDTPVFAREENRKILLQAFGHVVGIQDGHLRRFGQAVASHQRDKDPGNGQDSRAAMRRRRNGPDGILAAEMCHGMARQKRREMSRHSDRTHARASAPMRDAEGFMKIQVADVRSDIPRPA